jgi:hypothetical protein
MMRRMQFVVCLSALAALGWCGVASAEIGQQRLGRWVGYGWGPGYHAHTDCPCQTHSKWPLGKSLGAIKNPGMPKPVYWRDLLTSPLDAMRTQDGPTGPSLEELPNVPPPSREQNPNGPRTPYRSFVPGANRRANEGTRPMPPLTTPGNSEPLPAPPQPLEEPAPLEQPPSAGRSPTSTRRPAPSPGNTSPVITTPGSYPLR